MHTSTGHILYMYSTFEGYMYQLHMTSLTRPLPKLGVRPFWLGRVLVLHLLRDHARQRTRTASGQRHGAAASGQRRTSEGGIGAQGPATSDLTEAAMGSMQTWPGGSCTLDHPPMGPVGLLQMITSGLKPVEKANNKKSPPGKRNHLTTQWMKASVSLIDPRTPVLTALRRDKGV